MRRAGLLLLALGFALAAAGDGPALRFERPVTPAGGGPQALAVDVPLLSGAASPNLDDLRLFDADGREVPWLLVPPPATSAPWHAAARVLPIAATKSESGFEADLGHARLVDRLRLEGLGAPMLKRYRLEGSGDRSRWTLLVADGTLFDLPDEKLTLLEARFPASELRYLRVTWDDRRSARPPLPARAEARGAEPVGAPESAKVPVPFERRSSEPGKSRFRIRLPGPHLPIAAIEVAVSPGPLLRPARVLEYRLSDGALEPAELGAATLRRAERNGEVAADLAIPLRAPKETELELVVDDGNNPPLALTEVRLDLGALPWIYFESASGAPLTARFGSPSLASPRYDLEAKRAEIARAHAAPAAWGKRAERAPEAAASAPLLPAGAPVDATFRHRRAIPQSAAGLVSLALDAGVLGHSADLADVRVVDAKGRQVPYLLEKRDEPLTLALPAPKGEPRAKDGRNVSRYALALPYDTLPPARLLLATPSRVFDRSLRLLGRRGDTDPRSAPADVPLAEARWSHADPETAAPPLVLAFSPSGLTHLALEIDEGDNSALPLEAPKLLLPSFRLRFFAPTGEALALCYGAAGLAAPRYDIGLLAPRLAGASAVELAPGPESAAPAASDGSATERRVFWTVLAGAVLVLLGVMGRLMTRPAAPPAAS